MTIQTRCTLSCDIGLACIKQIMKTIVGPTAPVDIRVWATTNGWHSYGQRDVCPDCWAKLHSPTVPEQRDPDEDVQAAIDGERGG